MSASQRALSVLDAQQPGACSSVQSLILRREGGRAAGGRVLRLLPGPPTRRSSRSQSYWTRSGGRRPPTAGTPSGNNSQAYADTNDDNAPNPNEEIRPTSPHSWAYRLQPFHLSQVSFCGHPYPCSWNPNKPFSWRVNRNQNATQVFFFVNNWHDHLRAAPIGFTEAAGNFQRVNGTHKGKGGDAVNTQTDDGANTDHGLPDGNHIDNANMATPPDGVPPRMQMYLQHVPHTAYPNGDPFAPTNVGDEADTVYHEYTHGLSNRLVVDAAGNSTLGNVQAGAMGEAWSDWYAMDYLVSQGLQKDRPGPGNLRIFQYDGDGVAFDRTEPLDCKVGAKTSRCRGGATGHRGGYTYADYGQVIGIPEVHADGEIWSQTLWDLRGKLGSKLTESLVTRAMELSPSNPSMLDERNSILLADMALSGGRHLDRIWRVFAQRGMGYFAGAVDGNDSSPGADFHRPAGRRSKPASSRARSPTRTAAQPVRGATVTLAFQGGTRLREPVGDVTGAARPVHDRPGPGRPLPEAGGRRSTATTRRRQGVTVVHERHASANVTIVRDWAALERRRVRSPTSTARTSRRPCGPDGAIDQSQATGWGSTTGDDDGDPTNTFVPEAHRGEAAPGGRRRAASRSTRRRPAATALSASTARIHDRDVAGRHHVDARRRPGPSPTADDGQLNTVTPTAAATGGAVRAVHDHVEPDPGLRDHAVPGGAFAGCSFTDLTELEVFGTATP